MKIVGIVQARMGSSRLPGKVMKNVNNNVLIDLLLKRLSRSAKLDQILVATTSNAEDDKFANYLSNKEFLVYRGSSVDVLARYYEWTEAKADIVGITGDCPLVDPNLLMKLYQNLLLAKLIMLVILPTFPDGLDVEVFSFRSLQYVLKMQRRINRGMLLHF